jgi:hypothetical protein
MLQKSENSTDFTPSQKEPSKEPKNHQNRCISSFKSKISPVTISTAEGKLARGRREWFYLFIISRKCGKINPTSNQRDVNKYKSTLNDKEAPPEAPQLSSFTGHERSGAE